MASMVGGDLATLASLRRELADQADEAIRLRDAIQASVDNAVWKGANADKFRTSWDEFKSAFARLQDELSQASDGVRKQHNMLADATGEAVHI